MTLRIEIESNDSSVELKFWLMIKYQISSRELQKKESLFFEYTSKYHPKKHKCCVKTDFNLKPCSSPGDRPGQGANIFQHVNLSEMARMSFESEPFNHGFRML